GCCAGQQAAFNQDLLNNADLFRAQVEHGDAAATATVTIVDPRSGRNDVNDPAAPIHYHDLVVHDEEAVVAVVRVQIDEHWECGDRHKHDVPWHEYASVDPEVDRIGANPRPRHVARAEH